MIRILIFILLGSFLVSCHVETTRVEDWYELFPASHPVDCVLIKQLEYDIVTNKLKIEKRYSPTIDIFMQCLYYGDNGELFTDTTYYDSSMTIMEINNYKYEGTTLIQRSNKLHRKGRLISEHNYDYQNDFNSSNQLRTQIQVSELAEIEIKYEYGDNNRVKSKSYVHDDVLSTKEIYHYHSNGQLSKYEINLPFKNLFSQELYFYSDTIRTKMIQTQNYDTVRIEEYLYDIHGMKKEILITERPANWKAKVIINRSYK